MTAPRPKPIDNRTREVAPMEFKPLTTDSAPSFGRGRGKSEVTLEAERWLLICAEAQEKGGKNPDGSLKVPGIQLTDVGVTRTPTVDAEGNPVMGEDGEPEVTETFDAGYYKGFYAALKTAAENLKVTVYRREIAPHDIAISVTDRVAGPKSGNGAKAQGAAKKAVAAPKK